MRLHWGCLTGNVFPTNFLSKDLASQLPIFAKTSSSAIAPAATITFRRSVPISQETCFSSLLSVSFVPASFLSNHSLPRSHILRARRCQMLWIRMIDGACDTSRRQFDPLLQVTKPHDGRLSMKLIFDRTQMLSLDSTWINSKIIFSKFFLQGIVKWGSLNVTQLVVEPSTTQTL